MWVAIYAAIDRRYNVSSCIFIGFKDTAFTSNFLLHVWFVPIVYLVPSKFNHWTVHPVYCPYLPVLLQVFSIHAQTT